MHEFGEVWIESECFLGALTLYYIGKVFVWCRDVDFGLDLRCLGCGFEYLNGFWVAFYTVSTLCSTVTERIEFFMLCAVNRLKLHNNSDDSI